MPKPDAKPRLRAAPSRAVLDAQQQEAEQRLRTLETWTEDAAVRSAPAKAARAPRKKAPAPTFIGANDPHTVKKWSTVMAAQFSKERRAAQRAALYAIPIEQEHTLFVRIPERLAAMLEEVMHDRRHKSMRELVQLTLTELAEKHLGIALHKAEQPKS